MRKRNNLASLSYFHSVNFCIDCTYLSVSRVNGIRENSNFSSQLQADLHCASPLPYHVFLSCDWEHTEKVQVGKDQEKAQSEKDSHSKNRGGKKPN